MIHSELTLLKATDYPGPSTALKAFSNGPSVILTITTTQKGRYHYHPLSYSEGHRGSDHSTTHHDIRTASVNGSLSSLTTDLFGADKTHSLVQYLLSIYYVPVTKPTQTWSLTACSLESNTEQMSGSHQNLTTASGKCDAGWTGHTLF